jgi:hypothetical protein
VNPTARTRHDVRASVRSCFTSPIRPVSAGRLLSVTFFRYRREVAGVDGAANGMSVPRWSLSKPHLKGSRRLRKSIENLTSVTRVGLDLAKRVFQVHAVDATGEIVAARKAQAGGAAGSSPFSSSFRGVWRRWRHVPRRTIWGRTLIELGHEVKLIAPAHVKPYVRRNKNDAADAAAICEAAGRPGQRFVAVRSIDMRPR